MVAGLPSASGAFAVRSVGAVLKLEVEPALILFLAMVAMSAWGMQPRLVRAMKSLASKKLVGNLSGRGQRGVRTRVLRGAVGGSHPTPVQWQLAVRLVFGVQP